MTGLALPPALTVWVAGERNAHKLAVMAQRLGYIMTARKPWPVVALEFDGARWLARMEIPNKTGIHYHGSSIAVHVALRELVLALAADFPGEPDALAAEARRASQRDGLPLP